MSSGIDNNLLRAAREGDVVAVSKALDAGLNDETTDLEATIHTFDDDAVVNELLGGVATIDCVDTLGFTLLILAAQNRYTVIVEKLLAAGANMDHVTEQGITALNHATKNGHAAIVKMLLDAGANVDVADRDGFTPLHRACEKGYTTMVNMLIAAGADVNAATMYYENTPLHIAARKDHIDIVELSVDAGADVNSPVANGAVPLTCAIGVNAIEIVRKLLAAGARLDLAYNWGLLCCIIPLSRVTQRWSKYVLGSGVAVDHTDAEGSTPLSSAIANGDMDVVQCLLADGATIDLVHDDGMSPLEYATLRGRAEIARFLIDAGAVPFVRSRYGTLTVSIFL